ncbi:hypothetical protein FA95DRAFT_1555710 [Auriscalpium vulgare]|uniref:Uncharacterized protein n=1 Tax=Auriscalpium vulgare TaxID=40419 RepID=A0ACB8S2N2_9AGAM|nr:hypothetical protein FA95DRAFT_1555710 [Auriscalpium vulgare]
MSPQLSLQSNKCGPKIRGRQPLDDITNSIDLRSDLRDELSSSTRPTSVSFAHTADSALRSNKSRTTKENHPRASGETNDARFQHGWPAASRERSPRRAFGASNLANMRDLHLSDDSDGASSVHDAGARMLKRPVHLSSGMTSRPSLRNLLSKAPPNVPATVVDDNIQTPAAGGSAVTAKGTNTTSRTLFSSAELPPKTHKTASGQVVILPSHAALIDFREGERRKGRKGDEVLTVSPDGQNIQVFKAPHLSTPCCIAEPTSAYILNTLPTAYYRLYEQAARVVEHAKKKIPKLVMHQPSSTCTLLANGPQADVELVLNTAAPKASSDAHDALKIRLSRKQRTLEITSTSESSRDWSRKVMFCSARGALDAKDSGALSRREKEGMAIMLDFLRVVDAAEATFDAFLTPAMADPSSTQPTPASQALSHPAQKQNLAPLPVIPVSASPALLDAAIASTEELARQHRTPSTTSSNAFSDVDIAQRPKLSPRSIRNTSGTLRRASSTVVDRDAGQSRPQSAVPVSPTAGRNTRFIDGVGWCVRDAHGRYKIMFFDGVVLDVDVEEEQVEFVRKDGEVVRLNVRDCHSRRTVGERMKVFEEFVSLFDG